MNETEFNELFGTSQKAGGRRPKVNAANGQRLQKTDNATRYKIVETPFYVLSTEPLSVERLGELRTLAKAGPAVEKAAKAPAKDQ